MKKFFVSVVAVSFILTAFNVFFSTAATQPVQANHCEGLNSQDGPSCSQTEREAEVACRANLDFPDRVAICIEEIHGAAGNSGGDGEGAGIGEVFPPAGATGPCETTLFGIPPWYKYVGTDTGSGCETRIDSLNDIWKVVLAVFEAILRIGAYVAVAMVIYGGFTYSTSLGEPEKIKRALGTIRLAAIGLVVSIGSSVIVSFIAGSF